MTKIITDIIVGYVVATLVIIFATTAAMTFYDLALFNILAPENASHRGMSMFMGIMGTALALRRID